MGDNGTANEWLTRHDISHDATGSSVMDVNYWSHRAELAIRLGNIESAATAIARAITGLMRGQSARSSVRTDALQGQLFCAKGEPVPASLLDSFLEAFKTTKMSSLQDYSVESLLRVLEASNRHEECDSISTGLCVQVPKRPIAAIGASSRDYRHARIELSMTTALCYVSRLFARRIKCNRG